MAQQAGWYDDPEDREQLRYWDGVQWTNHVAPKRKPNLDRAGQAVGADDARTDGAPAQQGYGQQRESVPYSAQAGGQQQWQGQQGAPAWQEQGQWQAKPRPTTPDGQPLAGWWHRVGARLIDGVVIAIVGGFIASLVVPGFITDLLEWSMEVDDAFAIPPADLAAAQVQWTFTVGLVGLVYEIVLVRLLGGTLGKLATGLRIRLRDTPGRIGWGASVLRALVYQGVGLVSQLNAGLSFLGFFPLLDVLWPLWDSRKQAIHDKVARTNVVRTR